MPLYEYVCDACGHRFETIRKFSDPPLAKCPVCAGAVHKLQSAPAFQFKGSGWYITDYARKDVGAGEGSGNGVKAGAPGAEKSETSDKSDKPTKDAKTSDASTSTSPSAAAPAIIAPSGSIRFGTSFA